MGLFPYVNPTKTQCRWRGEYALSIPVHVGATAVQSGSFKKEYHAQALLSCCRSLSSKVVSQYSQLLSPMAVDAVLKVLDPSRPDLCVSCILASAFL